MKLQGVSLLVLLSVFCVSCCSSSIYKDGEKASVTGMVTKVGNEPFTRLGLRTETKLFIYFDDAEKPKVKDKLLKKVKVSGVMTVKSIETADRKYKRDEYTIRNFEVTDLE